MVVEFIDNKQAPSLVSTGKIFSYPDDWSMIRIPQRPLLILIILYLLSLDWSWENSRGIFSLEQTGGFPFKRLSTKYHRHSIPFLSAWHATQSKGGIDEPFWGSLQLSKSRWIFGSLRQRKEDLPWKILESWRGTIPWHSQVVQSYLCPLISLHLHRDCVLFGFCLKIKNSKSSDNHTTI